MILPLTWARKFDWRLVLFAAAITIAQVIFTTACARGSSWHERYLSLWTWDGGWYADISETGYRSTDPVVTVDHNSNVGFFPAYPLLARAVRKVTGWSVPISLLLTAQGAAFVFWWFLLRQLRDWKIASTISAAAIMVTFCHPAAFYLVVTYADSLFMATFLGLLVWGSQASRSLILAIAAAVMGYVCSAARIVGAPLAALPVVWAWNNLWPSIKTRFSFPQLVKGLSRYALISLATAFGTLSFFWYCAVRFGHWDLYMRTRAAGWQVFETDYLAIFTAKNFDVSIPGFAQDFVSPIELSHLYLAILTVMLTVVPLADFWLSRRKENAGFAERAVFYLASWLLFFFSVAGAGLAHGMYLGFLRYGFYTHVPMVLAVVHAHRQLGAREQIGFAGQIAIFLCCALGLALQAQFCYLYSHAIMVA